MEDESNPKEPLTDYKFLCFHGEPKLLFLTKELSGEPYADCYDMDFNKLDLSLTDPNSNKISPKPINFEKMKLLAKELSKDIAHLRVDFYEVNGKV